MRLINVRSLEIRSFPNKNNRPKYAILSHRWSEDGEISFEDFSGPSKQSAKGFDKVAAFCKLLDGLARSAWNHDIRRSDIPAAKIRPVDWCWIDTCCIDQRSSAELSEAINSMARWYADAQFCLAYLADVSSDNGTRSTLHASEDQPSEWFSRGWTLQELLFPSTVFFCDKDWKVIPGMNKSSDRGCQQISAITHIPVECLRNRNNIPRHCVASRMSWAAERETTRIEDEAYCLLGLFQVNMPLLYGEGTRAFFRLQQEILDRFEDETLFAWLDMDPALVVPSVDGRRPRAMPILAPHPSWFVYKKRQATYRRSIEVREPYRLTNRGLQLEASAISIQPYTEDDPSDDLFLDNELLVVQLNCSARFAGSRNGTEHDPASEQPWLICIRKLVTPRTTPIYARVLCWATWRTLWKHLRAVKDRDPAVSIGKRALQKYYIAASTEQMSSKSRQEAREMSIDGDVWTLDKLYNDILSVNPFS